MNKGKKLIYIFYHSKLSFALLSFLLSLVLVIGSTYAWYTDSDERINRVKGVEDKLAAVIEEDFNQVIDWAPGTTKTKAVRVTNVGEVPAIVRISFKEHFLSFETDKTDNHNEGNGNGNLKIYSLPSMTSVNVDDTDTWVVNNTYMVGTDTYYKANFALLDQAFPYKGTRTEPLPAIQLNFKAGSVFDSQDPPSGVSTDYWYYEAGYFYYSEILQPNDTTSNLLESVMLLPEYENQYKGALYKLVPQMDAHDISKVLISDWSIDTTGHVHDMYKNKLAK